MRLLWGEMVLSIRMRSENWFVFYLSSTNLQGLIYIWTGKFDGHLGMKRDRLVRERERGRESVFRTDVERPSVQVLTLLSFINFWSYNVRFDWLYCRFAWRCVIAVMTIKKYQTVPTSFYDNHISNTPESLQEFENLSRKQERWISPFSNSKISRAFP